MREKCFHLRAILPVGIFGNMRNVGGRDEDGYGLCGRIVALRRGVVAVAGFLSHSLFVVVIV